VSPLEETDGMEADVHEYDEVFAKGKDGVDAGLAELVVAPVEVDREEEDAKVQTCVRDAITEPSAFFLSEGCARVLVVQ